MCSSRSCASLTSVGASINGSAAVCVFGKAITSRMLSAPAISIAQAVESEGDAAVRRRAELECIEQESEFQPCLFRRDAEQVEHHRLQFLHVDAHRSAADLRAVQHHVVGLGDRLAGTCRECRIVQIHGAGERMMHGRPALGIGIPLEHREIHHPQRPPSRLGKLQILADLEAQRAECVAHHLGGVGAEENQIAVAGRGALAEFPQWPHRSGISRSATADRRVPWRAR